MQTNHRICSWRRIAILSCFALLNSLQLTAGLIAQDTGGKLGSDFKPPQTIDGSKKSDGATPANGLPQDPTSDGLTENVTPSNSEGQQIFDALFQELDNMIPGEFVADSEQKKAVEDAVTAFQVQNMNRVIEIFKDLSTKNKDYPPADLLLASLSYAAKDTNNGLLLLERAAMEHPEYPGVYSAFARLAMNQGRVSDALAMFEKCGRVIDSTQLDPVSKEYFEQQCLDGLIDVAMRQKKYVEARNYLDRQRKSLPDNPKVLLVSAELEFLENNIEKSQEFLETLKAKLPNTRMPESILATWFQESGKTEDARKWITAAANKYAENPQVQLEYASWLVNQEEFPAASSAIIKAEKAGSESLFSRNLKGKIAFCGQAFGVAEAHYKVISEAQPNSFDASNMYALSLIESGDETKRKLAREIATRNFRALPDNFVALAALGYIELRSGETEQAKAILTRVAQSTGSAPEVDFFLASLLEVVGEKEKAAVVLEATLKQKGVFLYRTAASQLLAKIKQSSDSLPAPAGAPAATPKG